MVMTAAQNFYHLMAIYGVCRTGPCQRSAATITSNVDVYVDPCDDFYDFACGNFQNRFPRMSHEKLVSQLTLRAGKIRTEVLKFYSEADLRSYPNLRKLRELYNQCKGEVTYGLETVGNHLAMVDLPDVPPFHQNPPDSYDVISTLAKVHRYSPSTTFLFDIDVRSDPQNFKANRITFGPTPSSINAHVKYDNQPKNDFELTTEKIREALVQNITKTVNFVYEKEGLKLNEEQNTKKNGSIQDVANFLIELEQIRNTDRFTSFQAWKYESLASLQDFTEKNLQGGEIQIYWYEYFEALFQGITNFGESERRGGLNWTEVMIMNPAQLLKVLKLLQRTSRHVFVCAIWFIVGQSVTFYGPSGLQDIKNEYDNIINDTIILPRTTWREENCANHLLDNSWKVVAYVLATVENAEHTKRKINWMIENIRESLAQIIQQSPWMDGNSKSDALLKLSMITTKVGYFDEKPDLRRIDQFYQNILKLPTYYLTMLKLMQDSRQRRLSIMLTENQFEEREYIRRNPASVVSHYYPNFLHIAIPSGIMGFPFYNLGLEALNYGTLGVLLASEMGHAFDNYGKMYAWNGKYEPLESGPLLREYEKREKCFEDAFGKFHFRYVDKRVDGHATLSQNIADSIGFEVALKAYRNLVRDKGLEPFLEPAEFTDERGRQHQHIVDHEQLFTLAYASMFCENPSSRLLSELMETEEHTVNPLRVNGVMKHSNYFATIWKCKANVPMNPTSKCTIFS